MKKVSGIVYLLPVGFGQHVKIKHINISAKKHVNINAKYNRINKNYEQPHVRPWWLTKLPIKVQVNSGEQFANPGKYNLQWKPEICSPETRRSPPFIEKVPALFPNLSIFIQMRNPNLHSLFGPDSTVLIGQKCVFWLVVMEQLWVSVDANKSIDWIGQVSA